MWCTKNTIFILFLSFRFFPPIDLVKHCLVTIVGKIPRYMTVTGIIVGIITY